MYLEVAPSGGKWWRLKYRFDGQEKRISLGTFPEVSLIDARARRDEARKLLAARIDPGAHRKSVKEAGKEKAANSFEVVAREWHKKQSGKWSEKHAGQVLNRFENHIFRQIGKQPIAEISAKDLLAALNKIIDGQDQRIETAHRILQCCNKIFQFAIVTERAKRNPASDLRGALPSIKPKHLAAIVDPANIGGLLRAIDSYQGTVVTKSALRLAPLVFVRPGELRHAEWSEIDLSAANWNIPAEKMKMKEPHLVPLSPQALAILRELHPLTGDGRYLFPSARSPKRPMSNNAVLAALRRMGYSNDEMTGHGFRAMARTVLDEVLHFRPDFIEHQLAHRVIDPNGRAYNRTAHLDERRKMMAAWANYLDSLKSNNT